VATAALAATVAAGAFAAPGDGVLDTTLASRAPGATGTVGDGSSFRPSISADGRFVAFDSDADNLDPDSNDAVTDVFVRDTQTGTMTLVSRATGAPGAVGDGGSFGPSVSADGRFVAFSSNADNLDPDSNDAFTDVFVRDTQTGTTTLVSRATAGAVGDGNSFIASISADGRFVAFESDADNLDPDSNDVITDVFVRDTQTGTTTLVSRAAGGAGAVGDDRSSSPSISADGRFVAFASNANNLDPDNAFGTDVFVRDTQTLATTLVSRATGATGAVGNSNSTEPAISADGRFVAFDSTAGNLDPDSDDAATDVFVRDIPTSTTTLASRATGATGEVGHRASTDPSISADGRVVAFRSDTANFGPGPPNGVTGVFVRDTQSAITTLASRATGATGALADGNTFIQSISADGRFVAFDSDADNLDPDSNDAVTDVFVRELSDPLVSPPGAGASAPTGQRAAALAKCKKKKGKGRAKCKRKAKRLPL
jgi:Tol biopolymer transport system component